jgi:hypothetical protein
MATLLLKESLKELANIEVEVEEVDTATYLTLFHEFNVPVLLFRWTQDIADPASFIANFATPAGFQAQTSQFYNETIIRLVGEAAASSDPATRVQLYREIQLEMIRKVATVPLLSAVAVFAERDWVLPSESPIGRGAYNPEFGDGDGGVQGGYHACYVWKADTTPQISISIGTSPFQITEPFTATADSWVNPSRIIRGKVPLSSPLLSSDNEFSPSQNRNSRNLLQI